MSAISRIVHPLARLRAAVRFRLWVARSRLTLARAGCRLEVVAPRGATFDTPPAVQPTRQLLPEAQRGGGGTLRIELGPWVHLGRDTTIEVLPSATSTLVLGEGTTLHAGIRLVTFGGRLELGRWTRVRDHVMVKSSGRLVTGDHTVLQGQAMLHCAGELTLEDHVTLAERVSVLDSDHQADGSDTYTQAQPIAIAPVHLGRNTWVGANAVVLRGVRLNRNAVVAAGSVVRGGDYPAGWLVAGVPATAKRALGDNVESGAPPSP